jgi:hypothetical protein
MFITTSGSSYFGFKKSSIEPPKIPLSIEEPKVFGIKVDRSLLIKKISRLALTSREELGISFSVSDNELAMETASDRKSIEKIPCKLISKGSPIDFILEAGKLKNILGLFQAPEISMHIDKTRCTLYNNADLITEENGKEPIKKPFTAIGLISLARVV